MEVKILKVIERHQILMLALRKQISQIKAAEELGLSPSHTKLLIFSLLPIHTSDKDWSFHKVLNYLFFSPRNASSILRISDAEYLPGGFPRSVISWTSLTMSSFMGVGTPYLLPSATTSPLR